ncbi:hypothetical protein MACH09_40220 [Vibrio sp. MACH09]|nr:hypothetical protein MACH09_40220 [Vibrio sp. MACH09]
MANDLLKDKLRPLNGRNMPGIKLFDLYQLKLSLICIKLKCMGGNVSV